MCESKVIELGLIDNDLFYGISSKWLENFQFLKKII